MHLRVINITVQPTIIVSNNNSDGNFVEKLKLILVVLKEGLRVIHSRESNFVLNIFCFPRILFNTYIENGVSIRDFLIDVTIALGYL